MTQGENGQWWDKTGHYLLPADDIVSDYYDGLGVPRLSYKYSSSLIVIRALLRAHGVVLQPGRARRPRSHIPAEPPPAVDVAAVEPPSAAVGMVRDWVSIDVREAMSMLWAGRSLDKVAEHFDAETSSFCEVMHRASTEFRRYRRSLAQARSHEDWLRRREEGQRARQERLRERERKAAEREREREERKREIELRRQERERKEEQERWDLAATRQREGDHIAWLYGTGLSIDEIAEGEGVSSEKVRSALSQRKVRLRVQFVRVDDDPLVDGWNDPEFVDYLREIQADATQVRGWTPQDSPLRRASEELTELLAMSHDAGVPGYRMAKRLGITHTAVSLRLRRHGYREMFPSQQSQGHYGEREWRPRRSSRETCDHGHPWIDENIRMRRNGTRICIPCDRLRGTAYRERKRAAAGAREGTA